MTFDDWLNTGIKQGWCSTPVCGTHDGTPCTPLEEELFEDGSDPCIPIIRIYEDAILPA